VSRANPLHPRELGLMFGFNVALNPRWNIRIVWMVHCATLVSVFLTTACSCFLHAGCPCRRKDVLSKTAPVAAV